MSDSVEASIPIQPELSLPKEGASNGIQPFSTKLEDYKFVKLIGGGSYGNVYEALDILTGRHVAMKALETYYALEEFAIYSGLFSDKIPSSILGCYGMIMDEEFPPEFNLEIYHDLRALNKKRKPESVYMTRDTYLILELCDGTLKDYVGKNGFRDSDVADYVRMIGSALQHMHDRGILYLDFNPCNVLFTMMEGSDVVVSTKESYHLAKIRWKLADFGFATRVPGMAKASHKENSLLWHNNTKKKIELKKIHETKTLEFGTRVARSPETYKNGKYLRKNRVQVKEWTKIDVWGMVTPLCQMVTERALIWTCYQEKRGKSFEEIKCLVEDFGIEFLKDRDKEIVKETLMNTDCFDKMLKILSQEIIDLSIMVHTEGKPNMRRLFQRCLVVDMEKRATLAELLAMEFEEIVVLS